MNITIEKRNAQKLFNLLNVANSNVQNKDIYFYLKYYVKTMVNQMPLSKEDYEVLIGHVHAFSNELSVAKWELRQFDPKKYDKFLNDFYTKVDFKKADTELMFKCKDILEVSPNKNDLYRRRMEFLDKKLPKISSSSNFQNNNFNNIQKPNVDSHKPVNPFAGINYMDSNPYESLHKHEENRNIASNIGQSHYQENNIENNNKEKNILRAQPPSSINNNWNNNNLDLNENINLYHQMTKKNTLNNNANDTYNFQKKKKIIPEDIKAKIIKELNAISEDLTSGKVTDCKMHSAEIVLLFKKIFPEE
jgi:hypothetical protein